MLAVKRRQFYIWIDEDNGHNNMHVSSKDLGARIRDRRDELGRSREDVAAEVGISPATLGRIERGQTSVKGEYLLALFQSLSMSFTLLDEESDRPERLSVGDHLTKIEYHTQELRKLLGK